MFLFNYELPLFTLTHPKKNSKKKVGRQGEKVTALPVTFFLHHGIFLPRTKASLIEKTLLEK